MLVTPKFNYYRASGLMIASFCRCSIEPSGKGCISRPRLRRSRARRRRRHASGRRSARAGPADSDGPSRSRISNVPRAPPVARMPTHARNSIRQGISQ